MLFFIRRMRYRFAKNRRYLLLALVLPLIYLGISAYTPSIFTISIAFSLPGDVPVAMPGSPTNSILLSELTASPSHIDQFLKGNYFPQLILDYPMGYQAAVSQSERELIYTEATTNLSVHRIESDRLLTTYTGQDREVGELLVAYYGHTLLRRIQEGYKRRNMAFPIQLEGTPPMVPTVEANRRLWDWARTAPALMFFAVGLLLVLLSQVLSEFLDPSYKSEKQIARHTRLPILGSLPNLNTATATATASHHHDM